MKLIDSKRKDFHAIQSYIKRIQWVKIRHFQFQSKQNMNFIDTYVYSFSKFSYISLAMEANSFS